jgi:uncharacterized protein (DUF58 family)
VIVPTRRLAWLAGACVALSVLAAFSSPARVPLFWMDGLLALLALLDVALVVGRRRFSVERVAPAIFSVGRYNVVTLTLRSHSRRRLRGVAADDPLLECEDRGIPAPFVAPAHASVQVRYEVRPTRRGPREFGAVNVRYTGPLGLMARQERTEIAGSAEVYPDVHAARSLELLRRQGRQDARLGSLRVRGGDTEFERLRPYQRGDEMRHIDWRATARRDDLTVRQFQAESNQNVVFALDVGRAMRAEWQGLTAVDHALNAALLAADAALRSGDRAGLLVFDALPRAFLAPSGGRTGARKLTRAAYALEPNFGATDYRAATAFLRNQVKARSLFVVLTNVLEPHSARELAGAMRALLPKHLPLCVLLRDTDVEALAVADARDHHDLYVRAAAAEALAARDALVRSMRNAGILVIDAKPDDLTPELVQSYLHIKARRLL